MASVTLRRLSKTYAEGGGGSGGGGGGPPDRRCAMRYMTAAVTIPVTITPRIVSIGFLVGPAVPTSALSSSNASTTSSSTPYRPRLPAGLSVKCDAAPMKKSIGNDITTLVRDARNARRAAPAAAGFAALPPAVATALAMTVL